MPRPSKQAECHPDEKHHGKGLCHSCYDAQWRADNAERKAWVDYKWYRDHGRANHQKRTLRKYQVPEETYDRMLEAQDGLCAICLGPPTEKRALAIDHCHNTGRIRGLLCLRCNTALGKFKDDPEILTRA